MRLSRKQRVSDALRLIERLIQEANSYLQESLLHDKFDASKPRMKDGVEPHRRSAMDRIDRKVREKIVPLSRDVLRARRERKARSRYQSLKNAKTPRKVLGSRIRTR